MDFGRLFAGENRDMIKSFIVDTQRVENLKNAHALILQLQEAGVGFGDVDGYVVQVLLGGRQAAVADVLVGGFRLYTASELMGDEGVPEVIDFDLFDATFSKVSIYGSADVSNEKRPAGFGNKEVGILDFGTQGKVILERGGGGAVQGDGSGGIVLGRSDQGLIFFDVFEVEIGQLGDAHAGLKEELQDGGNANIQTDGVPDVFDLVGRQDAGGVDFDFGVGEGRRRVLVKQAFGVEKLEEGF